MLKRDNIIKVAVSVLFIVIALFLFFQFSKSPVSNANVIKVLPEEIPEEIIVEESPESGLKLIGRAELSYAGGTPGRNKNIELGVTRIDGTTIAPGEEFSFTKALGSVNVEDGFSEERVFVNNEVALGLGGGLCQVSTVLFQGLISAGLPITERHNHTYSVHYYKEGLDAAFASPGPDLRFLNDTGKPIVIRGKNENQTAIFEIYGMSDGRMASTSEVEVYDLVDAPPVKYVYVPVLEEGKPECVNARQIGYSTKVKYNVLYPSGLFKEEVFTSTYKPLQKVCYIVGEATSTTP